MAREHRANLQPSPASSSRTGTSLHLWTNVPETCPCQVPTQPVTAIQSLPNVGLVALQMNPPSGRQSVLFFLLSEQIFLCQPTSHSPPLKTSLHSQRIRVEVSEQCLQALTNLLVRRPIGEGALPQHGIVAQFHRALPIRVAFLERALKSVDRIKLHFRSDLRVT